MISVTLSRRVLVENFSYLRDFHAIRNSVSLVHQKCVETR